MSDRNRSVLGSLGVQFWLTLNIKLLAAFKQRVMGRTADLEVDTLTIYTSLIALSLL